MVALAEKDHIFARHRPQVPPWSTAWVQVRCVTSYLLFKELVPGSPGVLFLLLRDWLCSRTKLLHRLGPAPKMSWCGAPFDGQVAWDFGHRWPTDMSGMFVTTMSPGLSWPIHSLVAGFPLSCLAQLSVNKMDVSPLCGNTSQAERLLGSLLFLPSYPWRSVLRNHLCKEATAPFYLCFPGSLLRVV